MINVTISSMTRHLALLPGKHQVYAVGRVQYHIPFMLVGLAMIWLGVLVIGSVLIRERRKAVAKMVYDELTMVNS